MPDEKAEAAIRAKERSAVVVTYRARARRYDFTANLYYLIGFRERAFRRRAAAALGLTTGGTVVEIGCGTGLNFELFQDAIGPSGRIIGVDLTDGMLAQARRRVEKKGWIPNAIEGLMTDRRLLRIGR